MVGAVVELATDQKMTHDLGLLADVYEKGRAKTLMTASKACLAAGAVGAVVGRKRRWSSVLSGLALLAGSALTRFAVFDAGIASANDPAHIVVPQRERIRRREEAVQPGTTLPDRHYVPAGPETGSVRAAGTRVRSARTARSSPSSGTNKPFVPARTCPVRRTGNRRGDPGRMTGASTSADPRRRIPRTDAVLADARVADAVATVGRAPGEGGCRRRPGRGPAPARSRPRPSSTRWSLATLPERPPRACAR